MKFDFDTMREFVAHCPASLPIKKLRLHMFDTYRYAEDYEKIYTMITDLGGVIE